MELVCDPVNIESKIAGDKISSVFAVSDFNRFDIDLNDYCSLIIDYHRSNSVYFNYLRIKSSKKPLSIQFSDYKSTKLIQKRNELGLFLKNEQNKKKYTIWLPFYTFELQFDQSHRISKQDKTCYSYKWEFFPHLRLNIFNSSENDNFLTMPFVIFGDNTGSIFDEFSEIKQIERDFYRKSDWFYASNPSDIWNYLINGSIYDPRTEKNICKRFKCQQCAYAWWNYFGFLNRKTGKKLYSTMQDEVAFSVLMDLDAEGKWGHGFWSNEIETHARFHLDGTHLLISQYEKKSDPVWLQAAELGIKFVFENLTDHLNDNCVWFLHDTIEHAGKHHFRSTIFGKSTGNSLCLNTHIQALTVLYRLVQHVPNKTLYSDKFQSGCEALHRTIRHRPAEILYKFMGFWILNYKKRKKSSSLAIKLFRSVENRILHKIYWKIQHKFTRLVYPNGFVERDATLSLASDRYMITNLKDLLLLFQQTNFPWLEQIIENSFTYMKKYLHELKFTSALERSPHFLEVVDILYLYHKLIKPLPDSDFKIIEETILSQTGSYSLDYFIFENLKNPLL